MTASRLRVAVLILAAALLTSAAYAEGETAGTVAAKVTVASLRVELALSREQASVGRTIQARAVVANAGEATVDGVTVTLRLDPVGVIVRKGVDRELRRLRGGGSASVSWALCGERAGTYVVLARVTVDSVSVDSPANLLVVDEGGGTCGSG